MCYFYSKPILCLRIHATTSTQLKFVLNINFVNTLSKISEIETTYKTKFRSHSKLYLKLKKPLDVNVSSLNENAVLSLLFTHTKVVISICRVKTCVGVILSITVTFSSYINYPKMSFRFRSILEISPAFFVNFDIIIYSKSKKKSLNT